VNLPRRSGSPADDHPASPPPRPPSRPLGSSRFLCRGEGMSEPASLRGSSQSSEQPSGCAPFGRIPWRCDAPPVVFTGKKDAHLSRILPVSAPSEVSIAGAQNGGDGVRRGAKTVQPERASAIPELATPHPSFSLAKRRPPFPDLGCQCPMDSEQRGGGEWGEGGLSPSDQPVALGLSRSGLSLP